MARFVGKTVLVTGGSGVIGSGVARHLLIEGAHVIVPVRSEASKRKALEAITAGTQGKDAALNVPVANTSDEEGAASLKSELSKQFPGGLDHVVSICGGWWMKGAGPLARVIHCGAHTPCFQCWPNGFRLIGADRSILNAVAVYGCSILLRVQGSCLSRVWQK
jgi:NAD(P)-dependent dehydrogenase (short-subunit alcohol dehydrogenase family)